MKIERTICWFSCGAASAVATKFALQQYDNCEIWYQNTHSEHPDNKRFLADCETWFKQNIRIMSSDQYKDTWDVWEKTRWLVGPAGARCTSELKRKIAESYINHGRDREIFGYTSEEAHRLERFKSDNPERIIECPLIDKNFSKEDCLGLLERVGIEIPAMYRLGYHNNNCIGCVKGQAGYWNKIRRDFPDVFNRMAKLERELDAAINKKYVDGERVRIFLDELPEDMGDINKEPSISCGLFCMSEADAMRDIDEC